MISERKSVRLIIALGIPIAAFVLMFYTYSIFIIDESSKPDEISIDLPMASGARNINSVEIIVYRLSQIEKKLLELNKQIITVNDRIDKIYSLAIPALVSGLIGLVTTRRLL